MNAEVSPTVSDSVAEDRVASLSFEKMSPGIDNYHIDVKLSRRFSSESRKLITLLVSQFAVPN
ncbi:MAG: hypothetical protein RL120_00220, partial [Gammaproteobacteria bacterium]